MIKRILPLVIVLSLCLTGCGRISLVSERKAPEKPKRLIASSSKASVSLYDFRFETGNGGQQHVVEDAPHGVGDGIVFLPYDVGQHHCHTIAGKAAPCAGHIAVARHEDKVDCQQHGTAYA